jgi:hypothetical protein
MLPKKLFFGCCPLCLFFHHWGWYHWLCQATQFAACLVIIVRVMHGAHVMTALFLLLLLVLVVVVCMLGCAD